METWGYSPAKYAAQHAVYLWVQWSVRMSISVLETGQTMTKFATPSPPGRSKASRLLSRETELYRRHGHQNNTGFAVLQSKQLYSDVLLPIAI